MTPQEQQMLMQLTQRINQTQLQEKDPDAENLLGRELGANPDAMYMLAQTVLVQNIALDQAKAQIGQLQQQLQQGQQQPAHATSFLGALFGRHDTQPQAPPPPPPQMQQPGVPPYQPVPQYQAPQPQYAQPQYQQPQYVGAPMGQPSFLRGAMQTAAGVAAGALAFEGVESILHGFGHGGGWGGGFGGPGIGMAGMGMGPGMGMMGGFERPVDETVVNNYYGAPGAAGMPGIGGEQRFDAAGNQPQFDQSAAGFDRLGQDHGGGAQFSDASYNTGAGDTAGTFDQGNFDPGMDNDTAAADNSVDDVQIDDSGNSFDDGGGGFDNSGDDSGF